LKVISGEKPARVWNQSFNQSFHVNAESCSQDPVQCFLVML